MSALSKNNSQNRPLSAVVVDDEALARSLIVSLIGREDGLKVIGQFSDGGAALTGIVELQPDIVFLDVQMSVMDGIAVAKHLVGFEKPPYVVFITAHDKYAINAFELNALDYLVKPVEKARFSSTINRAKRAIEAQELQTLTTRIVALAGEYDSADHENEREQLITVRKGDEIRNIVLQDISWVEAANQYVRIHTAKDAYLVSGSLSAFSRRLDENRFIRIHRSAIVNCKQIQSVSKNSNGTHTIAMVCGERLTLSRSRSSLVSTILRLSDT